MSARTHFAYMQARCQARYSLQLRGEWQRLSAIHDVDAFRAAVLRRPMHASLSGLVTDPGLHATEACLRNTFRRIIDELAAWMPRAWRPAVRSVSVFADLAAIQFLTRGGEAYAWLRDDKQLQAFLPGHVLQHSPSYAHADFARFLQRASGQESLPEVWARYWHALWPGVDAGIRSQLLRLENLVRQGRRRLADAGTDSSQAEIYALQREFARVFRQQGQTPAAAFAYLGLSWLELARIRAGLLKRRLSAAQT
ncbi:MAG: hypothetical protein KGK44_06125 [Gammaproteobacteria bacterium]|nr:hypothetical protein [Gammaproteobacteria bacterium]